MINRIFYRWGRWLDHSQSLLPVIAVLVAAVLLGSAFLPASADVFAWILFILAFVTIAVVIVPAVAHLDKSEKIRENRNRRVNARIYQGD